MRTLLQPQVNLDTGAIVIAEFDEATGPMDRFVMQRPLGIVRGVDTPDRIDELVGRHVLHVAQTRDAMTRAALIRLGWTPPANDPVVSDAAATDATRPRVRANDPGSSIIAAERAEEFAGSHCERILRALRDDELSSHQIAKLSSLTVVQVDRRLHELRRAGRIELVHVDGEELMRAGYRVWRRFRSA